MTRDNLRARGMPKPLECEMCKEVDIVKHLTFDCIVARQMWEDVLEVFDIPVNNFESIASKWLCNKRFLYFNVVTSAVLWGLWINRNNLVFNKTTWINLNQVWRLILSYLRTWKVSFQELGEGKTAQFAALLLARLKSNLSLQPP